MKKFDIEKAKNGAAVCLRDGSPVKILDFDFNGEILYKYKDFRKPERYLVSHCGKDGIHISSPVMKHDPRYDLFMEPISGYMIITIMDEKCEAFGGKLHPTLEEAKAELETIIFDKYTRFMSYAKVELIETEEE